MKKIAIILITACLYNAAAAQTSPWTLDLNSVSSPNNPNFGTSNNQPINFFTNGTQRMSLSTGGVLKINGLAGTGSRFLQADLDGNLSAWTGSSTNSTLILAGDGTWKPYIITVSGNSMSSPANSKFGIGVSSPAVALDVSGDIAATGKVTVLGNLMFSANDGLHYDASNGLLTFGKGSSFPPPAVDPCSSLPSTSSFVWSSYSGFVSSQVNPSGAPNVNAALRMYVSPSDGSGYLELNGTDNNNTANNTLYLNANCGRNTSINTGINSGIVRIGSSYSGSRVFVGDFINMNKHAGIGDVVNGITGSPTNVALDIHAHSGTGLRFRTSVDSIPMIMIRDTSGSMLKQSFIVLGDGATEIKTDNPNAFKLGYSQGPVNFQVHADGNVEMSSQAANAVTLKNANNGSVNFNIGSNGYTEIKSTGTKALSIYNGSSETVFLEKEGYLEMKITPSSMPNNRVIAVKDVAATKDLFVVKNDGKVYAREVEISLATTFPDYVFNDGYKLQSLKNVESYIKANKHLPGFEKGEYYEKNGVLVNDMLLKQQEKIEELTLYVIELEKRLNRMEGSK